MLTFENLRCFSEAARLLNFRAAARVVALTPAAFGNRIQQLEGELGVRLFHRTTRRVMLTREGLALVPYAHTALAAARECERAGRGEIGPPPMELVLGTRHELGMSFLAPLLPRLRAELPGLTFHLYFGSSADLLLRVRSLEIDCAVGSMRLTDPKLDAVRLHPEEYAIVAQPRLLRERPLRHADDTQDHVLIDTDATLPLFGYWRDAPSGGDRLRFASILRMGTIAAVRQATLLGEGIAVLPRYFVAPDLKAGRLTRLFARAPLLSDYFRLIFRADDPRRSIYESLARTLMKSPLR